MAGQTLYIITSPQDVNSLYRNTASLTFDEYVKDMMLSLGVSESGVDSLWRPSQPSEGAIDGEETSHSNKPLIHSAEDFYRSQLYPGQRFDDLQKSFLGEIADSLSWEKVPTLALDSPSIDGSQIKQTSLLAWCREILMSSATKAFFGSRLLQIEPDLFKVFFKFDDEGWKLNYKYPQILSQDMYSAKGQMLKMFESYFALPKAERTGEAWLVRTMEVEMRKRGMSESDISAVVMSIYWV